MRRIDPIPVLRRLPMFQELSEETLKTVAEHTLQREIPENGILFREGQSCRGLFIILDGSIKVYRSTSDGREQVLHVEGPKHTLAELPLFDGAPYPASARAAEDSLVLFLPRDAFQRLYRTNPEIADSVIHDLGRRLRRLVRLVDKVTLKDVPARVAATLIEEAMAAGSARDGGEFEVPTTQEEMANALATTRESVARALARFRSHGIIEQDGARVRILDLAALQDVAGVSAEALGDSLFSRSMPIP
ncbi:MAG: Crp/Fnr family transcriptional regulator [Candidatus Longimicrobiales bacterium M2_2A_002]